MDGLESRCQLDDITPQLMICHVDRRGSRKSDAWVPGSRSKNLIGQSLRERMVVGDDNQRTISESSGSKSVMDSNDIPVADTLPGLYSTDRVLIGQSEACDCIVSFQILE